MIDLDTDPRRDRILRAALSLCLDSTPDAVTIQQIRGRSGASTGSIYHHFGDKQGLFAELYLAATRHYHADLLEVAEAAVTAQALVRTLVGAHLAWVVDHTGLARFVHVARCSALVRTDGADLGELYDDFAHAIGLLLAPHAQRGEIRALPGDVALAIVLGPAERVTSEWLVGRSGLDPADAFAPLGDAAWAGLRHRATA